MVIRDDYGLWTASTLLGSLVTDQRREDLHTEHTKRKPEYEERTYTRYEWYDTVDCLPGFRLASSRQCACKSVGSVPSTLREKFAPAPSRRVALLPGCHGGGTALNSHGDILAAPELGWLLRAASYRSRVAWCDGFKWSHVWQPQMRGH